MADSHKIWKLIWRDLAKHESIERKVHTYPATVGALWNASMEGRENISFEEKRGSIKTHVSHFTFRWERKRKQTNRYLALS